MEKELISYYDLLGMVKEGNIPKYVYYVDDTFTGRYLYESEYFYDEFLGYNLVGEEQKELGIYQYLGENFLEPQMLEKSILIGEETKEADDVDIISKYIYGKKEEKSSVTDALLDAISEEIERQRDICNERLKKIGDDSLLSCHAVAIEKEHLDSLERIFKKIESIVEDELTEIHY